MRRNSDFNRKNHFKKNNNKELVIEPISKEQFQPASVDLRLGNHFLAIDEHNNGILSLDKQAQYT